MSKTYPIPPRLQAIVGIILAAALLRLLPHWPNVTPIAAIALFGGAQLGRRHLAFIIPMSAMFLSDLVLGFHSTMWAVYLGFAMTVLLGSLLRGKVRIPNLFGMVITSSVLFYLLTNFAVWIGSPFYPQNLSGLMASYAAGLPFLLNSLAGNIFYSAVIFGVFHLAQQRFPQLREVGIRS